MKENIIRVFQNRLKAPPEYIVRAPGRVNLIGEHTDYNDGFVLPMAIDRAIWIALKPRPDDRVILHSEDFPTSAEFSLGNLNPSSDWSNYVIGIASVLQEIGFKLNGWEGVLVSDIPIASGLSSSAALELAVIRAFWSLARWNWDGKQMALAAKKMENEWLNLQSGIMDQMISACAEAGSALLIDCRDLTTRSVPLPRDVSIVVMDTTVRRGLVDSAYNERVKQCQTASLHFGVSSLRDVSRETFDLKAPLLENLTLPLRRARHVVSENERTLQAAEAMQAGDAAVLGKLMNASHLSLKHDYEVSCRELDLMVEIALRQPGCLGARMTGAGFGGCAIALVDSSASRDFISQVEGEYESVTHLKANIFSVIPVSGANLIS